MHAIVHAFYIYIEQTNHVLLRRSFDRTYMRNTCIVHKNVNDWYGLNNVFYVCLLSYIAFIKKRPASGGIDLFLAAPALRSSRCGSNETG